MTEPPSISLAIRDLEREASRLKTESADQRATISRLIQRVADLEDVLRTTATERDSFMRLSAELKTLLDSSATLILEGLKRVREGTNRADTIEAITPTPIQNGDKV